MEAISAAEGGGQAARGSLGRALAAVLLLLSPAPLAAQDPSNAGSAFPEVRVDLAERTFSGVLPFDVTFQIVGHAPAGADSVEVSYGSRKEPSGPFVESSAEPLVWQRGPALAGKESGFRVTVPPLEPNRYYRFRIQWRSAVAEEQATAFAAKAREILDRELLRVATGDLTAPDVRRLRRALADVLSEATGAEEVLADDTLFDPEHVDPALVEDFKAAAREALEPQLRRRLQLETFLEDRDLLTGRLATICADENLQRLLRGLDDSKRELFADSIALTRLEGPAVARVAAGLGPSEDSPSIVSTTDPEALADRATNLGGTLRALDDLRKLVSGQVGTAPQATEPGEPAGAAESAGQTEPTAPALPAGLGEEAVESLRGLSGEDGALTRAGDDVFALLDDLDALGKSLELRASALDRMAARAMVEALTRVEVHATTTGDFETFQKSYVSADAGLLYAPDIGESVPYLGTNIYFRPVNKGAPLRTLGGFRETFTRRFALTLGLTASSVAEDGQRSDLFGSQALLVGAGIRLNDTIRFGVGALVFQEQDPSPLIDDESIAVTPFVSLSFDWNIARTFTGVGGLFSSQNK